MTTIGLPHLDSQIAEQMASAVSEGLMSRPKWLPSWLFYDAAGSELFNQITELPGNNLRPPKRRFFWGIRTRFVGLAQRGTALASWGLGAGPRARTRRCPTPPAERPA